MNTIFILPALIVVFFIVLVVVARTENLEKPTEGDLVFIRGPFNPDNGWVKGMEGALCQRGYVVEANHKKDDYLVDIENGQRWNFSARDLIVL